MIDGAPVEYWYKSFRRKNDRSVVESFCRQMLALCDKEYIDETRRLREEQEGLIRARKQERDAERGIDEAPGVILIDLEKECPQNPYGSSHHFYGGVCRDCGKRE